MNSKTLSWSRTHYGYYDTAFLKHMKTSLDSKLFSSTAKDSSLVSTIGTLTREDFRNESKQVKMPLKLLGGFQKSELHFDSNILITWARKEVQ